MSVYWDVSVVVKWKSGIEMAQPNVAREPSMEEILASIRRIIESNEPGQGIDFGADPLFSEEQSNDGAGEMRSPPAHVPAPANQAFGQRATIERVSPQPQTAQAEPQTDKTMSLADVAARVRAAADRNAAMAVGNARSPEAPSVNFASQAPNMAPAPVQQGFYGDGAQRTVRPTDFRPLLAQAPVAAREESVQRVAEIAERMVEAPMPNWNEVTIRSAEPTVPPVPVAPPAVMRPVAIDIDEPAPVAVDAQPRLSPLSANLLSELAEQEIARSFDELQNLFDSEVSQNVEEMTREMLRPMLQEWLEDNLPTIVERLVREEISRVVRGPKR